MINPSARESVLRASCVVATAVRALEDESKHALDRATVALALEAAVGLLDDAAHQLDPVTFGTTATERDGILSR